MATGSSSTTVTRQVISKAPPSEPRPAWLNVLPPSSQEAVTTDRLKAVERVMQLQYMPPAKRYRILADMFEDFELQDLGYVVEELLLKRDRALMDVQHPQQGEAKETAPAEPLVSKLEMIQAAKAKALAKRQAKQEEVKAMQDNLSVAAAMEWLPP